MTRSTDGEPGDPLGEAVWASPDGFILVASRRSSLPALRGVYWLLAEADGPVRSAMLNAGTQCTIAETSLFGGRFAITTIKYESSYLSDFFAGEATLPAPRLGGTLDTTKTHNVYAGPFSIIDLDSSFTLNQLAWTDGSALPKLWSAVQDQGLDQGPFAFSADAMFWSADNLKYAKVKVYTPATGVRDFLSGGMVTDHGYDDLGTDGHDLVWIEGKGRTNPTQPGYDTYDIMTAPYTSDPSVVVPRRLRSEADATLGTRTFVVGCGYAAHRNKDKIRVVRLSDGVSWLLDNGVGQQWAWSYPFALTCDELFAEAGTNQPAYSPHLVRVKLASLGPGIPPD